MIIISAITLLLLGISTWCIISKCRFDKSLSEIQDYDGQNEVDISHLDNEIDRIEELQNNLLDIKANIEELDIPTPESVSYYDTAQSSLNKISKFFEKHSLKSVGAEQFILSVLPTSQIGQSIRALTDALPSDITNAVFGDALHSIKDSIHSIPHNGLERFVEGMGHLGPVQMASIARHLEHHQISGAIMTPIKSGLMEAVGMHDATKDIACSLCSIGQDVSTSLETSSSITELTDASDVDFAGHVPVITIAISSFREFQLLSSDKTDYITSLKNIALDAAGAGVGGMAGAKAGAVAGGFFGPIGAILGGVIGGIGGAVAGRYATNKVKMVPLKNAIEAYKKSYENMRQETDDNSKETLSSIKLYAESKHSEFKDAELLNNIPVADTSSVVVQIAIALYQFLLNEICEMKMGVTKLKSSFWYSEGKYGGIVNNYLSQIDEIENQLPPPDIIQYDPSVIVSALTTIKMPNRKVNSSFQSKLDECCNELKIINDKNDSNVLVWSYMINNLYQQTLNDIADYSNKKMKSLNGLFKSWSIRLGELEKNIEKEKGKLGLN